VNCRSEVSALAMRHLDCRPNLLRRNSKDLATRCKLEKIAWNDSSLFSTSWWWVGLFQRVTEYISGELLVYFWITTISRFVENSGLVCFKWQPPHTSPLVNLSSRTKQ
jgi:hypothetical protein